MELPALANLNKQLCQFAQLPVAEIRPVTAHSLGSGFIRHSSLLLHQSDEWETASNCGLYFPNYYTVGHPLAIICHLHFMIS